MQQFLDSNYFFDYDDPAVIAFADKALADFTGDKKQLAIRLYEAVRDGFKYNPYQFNYTPEQYRASDCVRQTESYCIPKAVLLGALARSKGIPARLGLSNVRNHVSSKRLLKILATDVFVMHGYVELYIADQWVKATPAFDSELCHRTGVEPLAFDGERDSVFQEFNLHGKKHMEYLFDHGTFADVPVDLIHTKLVEAYPHLFKNAEIASIFGNNSLERDLS